MSPLFLAVALLAVVAFLQLGLYLSLRLEVQGLRKSLEGKINAHRETKESLREEMVRISEELVDLNTSSTPTVTIGQSMNLSRRNQVLRMHLRGDSPSRIAGALKISKSEVDLLLKVHKTVLPPTVWSSHADPTPARRRVGETPVALEGEPLGNCDPSYAA